MISRNPTVNSPPGTSRMVAPRKPNSGDAAGCSAADGSPERAGFTPGGIARMAASNSAHEQVRRGKALGQAAGHDRRLKRIAMDGRLLEPLIELGQLVRGGDAGQITLDQEQKAWVAAVSQPAISGGSASGTPSCGRSSCGRSVPKLSSAIIGLHRCELLMHTICQQGVDPAEGHIDAADRPPKLPGDFIHGQSVRVAPADQVARLLGQLSQAISQGLHRVRRFLVVPIPMVFQQIEHLIVTRDGRLPLLRSALRQDTAK